LHHTARSPCYIPLTEALLYECDSPALGLNLDTGNLWLGGGDPIEYVEKFGQKIEHVLRKDMPQDMEAKRGEIFGYGMALIPLGTGVIGIKSVFEALSKAGFDRFTALEVAGAQALKASYKFLKGLGAE